MPHHLGPVVERPDDPDDPGWAHLLVEAARQAGWDRPAVLHEHADGGSANHFQGGLGVTWH